MTESERLPLKLYFIRHGETAWSRTRQHTGRTDLPLTAAGEAQARALIPWLSPVKFVRVFSSPLQRAGRTCALAGFADDVEIEPDLLEWNYGDYEGKRSADIRKQRADWNCFRDGCSGGETPEEIAVRADRLILRLSALAGNVALYSHGDFAGALASRWLGLSVEQGSGAQTARSASLRDREGCQYGAGCAEGQRDVNGMNDAVFALEAVEVGGTVNSNGPKYARLSYHTEGAAT